MKKYLFSVVFTLVVASSAHAAVVLSDSFTYPDGDISTAPGSPWMVHSGSTPANITNNELRLTGGNSADVNALLAGGPYLSNSPAVLYASFKMRLTSQPGNAGTYFAHFKDTNTGAATGFGGRIFVCASNAYTAVLITNTQIYRVGIANGSAGTSASGQIDQDLFLNTNYIVVTRFVPQTGISTIWLNPTAESDPSVTAADVGTPARPNPIDVVAYAFRQAFGIGVPVVDNLKVGTTFVDVAGLNSPPSISGIAPQHIAAGTSTAALPLTIGDAETAATSLTLSGTSSLQSLVPDGNIAFAGSGSNRTVTVTPIAGQQGVATITIGVTDEGGITANATFQVFVGVPTISDIPNQTTPTNTTLGPLSFTVSDTETPAASLTVTATSGNQSLIPDGNITLGGSGTNRTVRVKPATDQAGLATITVTVSDGTSSSSDTFVLTVNPLLGLLRSDNFNRPDGRLVTGNGEWVSNGGTGGTNIGELRIGGNKISVTENGSEDVSTEMPVGSGATYAPASGTILYVSMRAVFTNLPTAFGTYFAHFKADAFDTLNFRGRVFAATTGAASGKFRLGVANNAASISAAGLLASDLSLNSPYLIVVRYNVGTGETRLWIDPISETSPGMNALDTPSPSTIGAFTFRQNTGMGGICVDDLKIGASFSDVAQARPALAISRSGSNVTISWGGVGTLQYSDNLAAPPASIPWQSVPGAPNPYTTATTSPARRFYRVTVP